ncbi:hypothetical protein RCH18_001141 [Flavobacterium sp. PL11]|uniref:GIY-YIG nuclease family protein n=1 Tax=Flavobacterium sp. PL11 TaxID=3071717 RepID=UPI002E02D692|nr:hypothetical protein [Flavobacterium sp. PL11]
MIHATLIPRNKLLDSEARQEIKKYGVCFLFGINEDKAKPIAYIGETDDCFKRLKDHNRQKEFSNYAIAITSKSEIFTKSHVKFLEYYCVKTAKEVGRYDLENLTVPTREHISESMEADLHDNFETMKILLSTLGFPIFEEIRNAETTSKEILHCKGKNALAQGELSDDGFVVFKGSKANIEETKTAGERVLGVRNKLKENNIIQLQNDVYIFTEDYLFGSPSAAAAAVLGRRANGWTEWKNKDKKTIDEIYRII